jgi:hypothetical protein
MPRGPAVFAVTLCHMLAVALPYYVCTMLTAPSCAAAREQHNTAVPLQPVACLHLIYATQM